MKRDAHEHKTSRKDRVTTRSFLRFTTIAGLADVLGFSLDDVARDLGLRRPGKRLAPLGLAAEDVDVIGDALADAQAALDEVRAKAPKRT